MTPNNALDLTSPFRHNQTFLYALNWVGPRGFGSMFGDTISVSLQVDTSVKQVEILNT